MKIVKIVDTYMTEYRKWDTDPQFSLLMPNDKSKVCYHRGGYAVQPPLMCQEGPAQKTRPRSTMCEVIDMTTEEYIVVLEEALLHLNSAMYQRQRIDTAEILKQKHENTNIV